MAYRVNGSIIIDNSGNIQNVGVATIGLVDGRVSAKAITEQADGGVVDVTGADELLIYDQATTSLLRVTVDEFISGAGIGTLVADFDNLNVVGIITAGSIEAGGVSINSGIVTAISGIVTYYGDGSNLTGISTIDTYVTGFTFNPTTYDLTLKQNEGQPDLTSNLSLLASDVYVVSGEIGRAHV